MGNSVGMLSRGALGMALVLFAACGGSDPAKPNPADSVTVGGAAVAINLADAKQAVTALGGDAADAAVVKETQDILAQLPPGTTAVAIGKPTVTEAGGLRTERTPYELRTPGKVAKPFTLNRLFGQNGTVWVLIGVVVGGPP